MHRTVEINDTLQERLDSAWDDVKELAKTWLDENGDDGTDEAPELFNDLDYDGSFHEIIDSSTPIYTNEIRDLFYLYGVDFDAAFDDAGFCDKDDDKWPCGWRAAAIYCYLEQAIASKYEEEKEDIFREWREANPVEEEEEDTETK